MGDTRRRVLIVHSSDELYGADRILLHVIATLRDLDVDLEVWLPSDVSHGRYPLCERLEQSGVTWRHVDLPILRRAAMRSTGIMRLARASLKSAIELRHGHHDLVYLSSSACLPLAPIARLVGVPCAVLHVQERWDGRSATLLRWLAASTTARVAISRYVAAATGLDDPAPVVVENVVEDASVRVPNIDRPPEGRLRFVVASRWNRWKGHRTLLDAWERAGCPGTLTVLGGPPSSGEAVDVSGLAMALSHPDSVQIVGEVEDIAPYVASSDVLVLPSDDPEPFGLVLIEAFSLRRPVIAPRAGGPVEIVEDGVSGWFFEPRDASSLADLLAALRRDDVRAAGMRARSSYEERYQPARFRRELAAVISREFTRAERSRRRR